MKKFLICFLCIIATVILGLLIGFASYWTAFFEREKTPEPFHLADNGLTGSAQEKLLPPIQTDPAIAKVAEAAQASVITIVAETLEGFEQGLSLGSGVIFEEDETFFYVVTNAHVLADATAVYLYTTEGDLVEVTEGNKDEDSDLAVVRIAKSSLTDTLRASLKPVLIGDSDTLRSGDVVIAVGSPEDIAYQNSVTLGVVSDPARIERFGRAPDTYIQTDAAINPGNSGGGLFTLDGCLVGIISNKYVLTELEGLGFAIPINRTMDKIRSMF
ncbi:MAG: trypsin-like peptidase domain-containing protein [Firmicutes bacterium]|nr:trypsin-like peptidase domain-containing protein [Bacillota bacterium]